MRIDRRRTRGWPGTALLCIAIAMLAACTTGGVIEDRRDPAAVRAQLERLLPEKLADRSGWARDIEGAFSALSLPADAGHLCAALAITEQESSFRADPSVPNLPKLAREEIDKRAARLRIPAVAIRMALQIESPTGLTFDKRLDAVRTERELSEIYEDFIAMVPLGARLLAGWNPVRTGGPMQVSIDFAERHARRRPYPYETGTSIRQEVFTRRGGLYFGIAHLLDYPADYPEMRFRFADFNAGHYASRNAAFQRAVAIASGRSIAIDGDLIRHGAPPGAAPGETEAAVRGLGERLGMSDATIRRELELGASAEFDRSPLLAAVYALAETSPAKRLPRAAMPEIRLEGPKIQRKLTTAWFADRVEGRWRRCVERAAGG
ncbi:MAG: DUF1615 domain-containing protein [Burkholderiaceae bacterium]|nr:DUF1615 domain-containing protein [Burkholderiaceae bacterium]